VTLVYRFALRLVFKNLLSYNFSGSWLVGTEQGLLVLLEVPVSRLFVGGDCQKLIHVFCGVLLKFVLLVEGVVSQHSRLEGVHLIQIANKCAHLTVL
jgi:hypothetical protein